MTHKKVGGRESGGEATYQAGVGTLPTAAADPARLYCDCDFGGSKDPARACDCEKGVRALEARLDDVKDEAAVEMRVEEERRTVLEARVKELSAMLYELRSQRDYAMAIQEDRER